MNSIERLHTNTRMSKIVRHGGLIYLCGQTAAASASAEGDVAVQTHEALARIDALLREAGADRSCLLSALVHLRDISDFGAMNTVWEAWLAAGQAPARTTVEARMATPGLRVEITVVAAQLDR